MAATAAATATVVAQGSRKRGAAAAFWDDPYPFDFQEPPPLAKRGRCSPSMVVDDITVSMEFDPVDALQVVFPGADPKLLWNYFEASGNVLDAAINSFKTHLAYGGTNTGNEAVSSSQAAPDAPPATNTPTNTSEWAELIVKEMTSALNLIDAKNRAFQILEVFKKSTTECCNSDATRKMHEEHKILKQMLGGLLHQNGILKRAFMIQHNRLKDYHDMVQERSQFKEAVCKYQEQIKALEDRNYVLSFHLEQSKQRDSIISGHHNPDVF